MRLFIALLLLWCGPALAGDFSHTLEFEGRTRRYEVHTPPNWVEGQTTLPVVFNLHGGGGTAQAARQQTKMDATADANGFIVVYPEGTGPVEGKLYTWNAGICCGYAVANKINDVGFISAALDDVASRYGTDQRRAYITGMSNGSMMAYRCAVELGNRFAAVCGVSSTLGYRPDRAQRPLPVLHAHGLLDQNAPFAGGVGANAISKVQHQSVPDMIGWWCSVDRVPTKPDLTVRNDKFVFNRFRNRLRPALVVDLIAFPQGGHQWPGGTDMTPNTDIDGPVADFDLNAQMWGFFKTYSLPLSVPLKGSAPKPEATKRA